MALDRVDRLEREFGITVEWKGFEIHPEYPEGEPLPPPSGARFAQASEVIRRMAADAGLPLAERQVRVSSHRALEAAELARERGRFQAFHRRLFQAAFADGQNIGDLEVLARLGEEVGLDPDELRRAVTEHRFRSQLDAVTREAHAYGITGTPTFLIGPYALVGAQPYEILQYAAEVALGRRELPGFQRSLD